MRPPLPDDLQITVCDACLCASCWQGEFYCEEARSAGTVRKTITEMRALHEAGEIAESPDWWERDVDAIAWRKTQ